MASTKKGEGNAETVKGLRDAIGRLDSSSEMDAAMKAELKAKLQARIDELERALVALSLLKRMGRAVVVFANVYEPTDFIAIAGPLMSVGIESRHLRDEETLRTLCNRQESVTLLG